MTAPARRDRSKAELTDAKPVGKAPAKAAAARVKPVEPVDPPAPAPVELPVVPAVVAPPAPPAPTPKPSAATSALGKTLSTMFGAASTVTILFGIGYIVDCRFNGNPDVAQCWLTGGTLAGLGTAGQAGYRAGYWTPNPSISQDERNRVAPTDTPQP